MDKESEANGNEGNASEYLKQTGTDFYRSPTTGLYEPKSHHPADQVDVHVHANLNNPPSVIERPNGTWRDGVSNFIKAVSLLISGFTLVGLAGTVYWAAQTWQTMNKTYGEIQKQTAAVECEAQAAQRAADTASNQLNLSKSQMKLDQRAWLGIAEYRFGAIQKGQDRPPIELKLVNTGKSPALHVTFGTKKGTNANPIDWKHIPQRKEFQFKGNDLGALAPEAPRTIRIPVDLGNTPTASDYFKEIDAGRWTWYVYGIIRYKDALTPQWHHTQYCFFLIKDKTFPEACPIPVNMD